MLEPLSPPTSFAFRSPEQISARDIGLLEKQVSQKKLQTWYTETEKMRFQPSQPKLMQKKLKNYFQQIISDKISRRKILVTSTETSSRELSWFKVR